MPEGLARYGLNRNPYQYKRALDPLTNQADKGLMVSVDGFGNMPKIDEYLRSALESKQAAFFMITGKSGTGRSSFANYILRRYCELKEREPDKLLVPEREFTGHNKVYIIKQWFGFLRTEINLKKIGVDDQVKADFQTYLETTSEATLEPNFKDIALRVGSEIDRKGYSFACCMEDVEDFSVIDAAVRIFSKVPTVCVFTVKDYNDEHREIVAPFKERCKKLTGSGIFELSQLSATEVRKLVEQRWADACALENPFDLTCFENVFGDKHRAIGLTLTIMARLIDNKLANYPQGAQWPDARELAFSCVQLSHLVPMLEKDYD